MQLEYFATLKERQEVLNRAENDLLNSEKLKFQKIKSWRENVIPSYPGVYALYENKDNLLYIGETGNLKERMSDICRTVNHTFRRKLAHKMFGVTKTKSKAKFGDETESLFIRFIFRRKIALIVHQSKFWKNRNRNSFDNEIPKDSLKF